MAGIIIGAMFGVLIAGVLGAALVLRICLRRSRTWGDTHGLGPIPRGALPSDDGITPALARLQRALAKGGGTTPAELDSVSPVEPFTPGPHDDAGEGNEHVCAICLDEMPAGTKSRRLPCGHAFDAQCIEQWCAKANRCPICNASPVDAEELAMKRATRAASMLHEFTGPRGRRRRERDPDGGGGFRLTAVGYFEPDGTNQVILLPPPPGADAVAPTTMAPPPTVPHIPSNAICAEPAGAPPPPPPMPLSQTSRAHHHPPPPPPPPPMPSRTA